MTKRVQLAGQSTETERVLVGLERELRVDLENDSLRLHDGVKEGGYEILNRDANDGRYQARSLELDGFSFGAQEKGILVRVGPANYKVRRITVDEGQLAVTNPRGTLGDIHLNILQTVTTDHIWTGVHQFTQPIDADGGVVGNVTGNLTGDSFGTHTGPVIGNADGDHTGSFTGDVDVRGHTIQFDAGQIPGAALDPVWVAQRTIPMGTILMWSGLADDIPEYWALCDGNNGTPDLRNRFIIGAGGAYAELASGGSETHSHTGSMDLGGAHTHDVTVGGHALTIAELPAHKHGNGVADQAGLFFNHGTLAANPTTEQQPQNSGSGGTVEGYTTTEGGGATHTHPGSTTTEGGAHSHNITLDDETVLPPYFALCFIMKTV